MRPSPPAGWRAAWLLPVAAMLLVFIIIIFAAPGSRGQSAEVITETIASGLVGPWALAFAADGRLFLTEQPGRVRVIDASGLRAEPVLDLTSIVPGGEAGMLGLAVDPNFLSNHFLYVFHSYNTPTGIKNRVIRLLENNNHASVDRVILDNIDGGMRHNAGRIKIGPDSFLYAAVGDGSFGGENDANRAQSLSSTGGKILRMRLDGTPAPGNPFPQAPYVYALGLRDPQGIAFDSSGQLYATDHGPTSNDEVNITRGGGNYGWPICVGICNNPAFIDPIRLFFPETVPPSGATFYSGTALPWNGSFFFAVLGIDSNAAAARHLHRILFDRPGGTRIVQEEQLFKDRFGRLREVIEGPDGNLYFTTDNRQASAAATADDDRVIRVRAAAPVMTADFGLAVSPDSSSVSRGQAAMFAITVTPISGFNVPVTLSCTGLPAGASCAFTPNPVTPGGAPASANLTISTTAASAQLEHFANPGGSKFQLPMYALWFPFGLALVGSGASVTDRKRKIAVFTVVALIAAALMFTEGCGGGNSTPPSTPGPLPPPSGGTPVGSYTITIIGASGALQHATMVTLTVK